MVCDWPHCTAESNLPFHDGWASCDGEGIPFLPKDVMLCPKHSEMYEEVVCNPFLLDPGEDEEA